MKRLIFLAFACLIVLCSAYSSEHSGRSLAENSSTTDSLIQENDTLEYKKSLNEIRFEGWDTDKWLDNDYIRAVHCYLDEYNNGTISNDNLDPYREKIKSKFVVGDISPSYFGGAYIQILFLDMPDRIVSCWVYSDVNEITNEVSNYNLRTINVEDVEIDNTKEAILQIVSEHPELKLW